MTTIFNLQLEKTAHTIFATKPLWTSRDLNAPALRGYQNLDCGFGFARFVDAGANLFSKATRQSGEMLQ